MALTLLLFLGSAAAIYFACEFFVNGVEWVGQRANVSQTATGTVLAAFGTALPESVVTFIAVVFGANAAEKDIGVGAALGGPLVLSTLAYAAVGLTLIASRSRSGREGHALQIDSRRISRDQGWFLAIFVAKVALGLVGFPGKAWFGFLFVAAYGIYVWRELRGGTAENEDPEPLKIRPRDSSPDLHWAGLQTVAALVIIFAASRIFVSQLGAIGAWLGLPPQLVALLLSPIATEMPETMNAIIWVRQGKERLALANISGAMMIQATIPSAFGLFFTPWRLERPLVLAAGVTMAAIVALFVAFRRGAITGPRLCWVGLLYLVFIALLQLA